MLPVAENGAIPEAVRAFLGSVSTDLRRKKIGRVRITPLLLRAPIADLFRRRRRLFLEMTCDKSPWGWWSNFRRRIKPTAAHSEGRIVQGRFAVVALNESLCLLVSTLSSPLKKPPLRVVAY
jgi:hypothetical protein